MSATTIGIDIGAFQREVSPVVADTLFFLQRPYPRVVGSFLDWYETLPETGGDARALSAWVTAGVPHVRAVLRALDEQATAVNRLIDRRFEEVRKGGVGPTSSRAAAATDPLYEGLLALHALMRRFIGCDRSLSAWFLGLTPYIANATLRQRITQELEDRCLSLAVDRLQGR